MSVAAAHGVSDRWLLAALRSRGEAAMSAVESLWDSDLQSPSLRDGWTTGRVMTHLARDADRRADVLAERRTGAVPAFDHDRRWDEEPGSFRPGAVVINDALDANDRFEAELAPLEKDTSELPPAVTEVLQGRLYEVVVHHADLGEPLTDLPDDVAADLLPVAVAALAGTSSHPIRIDSSGPDLSLAVESQVVAGTSSELLAWATDRPGAQAVAARCGIPSPSPTPPCAK